MVAPQGEAFLGPVTITAMKPVLRPAATSPVAACVPQWHDLTQGPSGRRVLETCGTTPAEMPAADRSHQSTNRERLMLPKSPHASLAITGHERGARAPNLVIGDPKFPDPT
jgi:hypothetical protein